MDTHRRKGQMWMHVGWYSLLAVFMLVYAKKVIEL
jgi:hypothetical protein